MAAVGKLLLILKELKLPVIGVIENMKMNESSYVKDNVSRMGLNYLNSVYFDENLEDSIGEPDKIIDTSFMKDLDKIIMKSFL